MSEHVCDRMVAENEALPNYDSVAVEKDTDINQWELTGVAGNERICIAIEYCPFCGKELASL
ncbi:hypothetical protein [Bacillus mycoides]|uniref:hypothetical protein n=1 Tax=Bacillus mycoides TaxID=1405 RepID=UPI003A7FCC04